MEFYEFQGRYARTVLYLCQQRCLPSQAEAKLKDLLDRHLTAFFEAQSDSGGLSADTAPPTEKMWTIYVPPLGGHWDEGDR